MLSGKPNSALQIYHNARKRIRGERKITFVEAPSL